MAKQLNVNLAFTADTGQAKASILELQKSLTQISAGVNLDKTISPEKLQAASAAAKSLSMHLNNAFNAQTGNFDLSKLNASLSRSNQNVASLSNQLLSAGKSGQQAFVQLAQSISMADRPLVSLGAKMSGLLTTLKNTAKWQISSSILHGFMGAISTAYNYAQDLNESLNNIRIVTGYSVENMEEFALQANKAAKALSATTNEYTKASLIYFQQGLSDKEVQERTAITIKMANVSRQSAEEVSDQLTSVWNNFYNGTKELEYYVDAMTALGAATASSSEEIAKGLEKFAASAETVGLSYEYATAALATVTATTRQSADVVGTAFKTLFARLNDLKLGETLEDGTTLGKYTENLASIGVNIKDANGQLKDMDTILTETAAKWDKLSRDQQTALAKGVAGIRQYTQFIALMDNWDFMEENLRTVENSSGTLQRQADIYAESWEAASKQVQVSLEAIYTSILDDNFFIDLAKGFSTILDGINSFIKGVGGIKTVFMGIGAMFLSSVAGKIGPALQSLAHNFSIVFQTAQQQATNLAKQMNESIVQGLKTQNWSLSSEVALKNAQALNTAKAKLQAIEKSLTAEEKQRAEGELAIIQNLQSEAETMAKIIEQKQQALDLAKEELNVSNQNLQQASIDGRAFEITGKSRENGEEELIAQRDAALADYQASRTKANQEALTQAKQALNDYRAATDEASFASEKFTQKLAEAYIQEMKNTDGNILSSTAMVEVSNILTPYAEKIDQVAQAYNNHHSSISATQEKMRALQGEIESVVGNSLPSLTKAFERVKSASNSLELKEGMALLKKELKSAQIPAKNLEKILSKLGYKSEVTKIANGFQNVGSKASDLSKKLQELEAKQKAVNKAFGNFNPSHTITGLEKITSAAAGLGQVAMVATSIRSAFQALTDEDMGWGEKLTTIFMSISMLIPGVLGAFKSLNTVMGGSITLVISAGIAQQAYNASLISTEAQSLKNLALKQLENGADALSVKSALAKMAVKKGLCKEEEKELFINQLLNGEKGKSVIATMAETAATKINTAAQNGNKLAKMANALSSKVAATLGVALGVAKTTETGAVWANTAAWYANPIMWLALVIVGVVGALVGLIAIIKTVSQTLSDAYNADAIAAENAEKAAENLTAAYEDAKTAYEEMIGAMEEYETAREGLEELTKGTLEYEEALQKANRAAIELIQNYPEYFPEGSYHWEDGELIVNKAMMERAKQKEMEKVSTAYAAATTANATAKEARAISNTKDAKREQRDAIGLGNADQVWGAIGAHAANLTASLLIPGLGTLITTALTTFASFNQHKKAGEYDAAVDKVLELYSEDSTIFASQQHLTEALAEVGIEDSKLVAALYNNRESLIQLGEDFNQAALAMKVAAENIANELVRNNEKIQNSDYAEEISGVIGKAYEGNYKMEQEKALKDIKDRTWLFNTGTDEAKAVMAEYAKATGLDQDSNYKVTNYVGDGTVKINKTLEDGSVEEVTVTAEEIAATVAASRAQDMAEGAMDRVLMDFEALGRSAENEKDPNRGQSAALMDFLSTGSLENSTSGQLGAIQQEILVKGDGTLTGDLEALQLTAQNLDTVLSGNPEDYGYGSWLEMAEALTKAAEDTEEAWNNIELPEGLENTENLTLKGAQNIQNDIEQLRLGPSGEEGVKAYTEGINSLTAAMGEADKEKFLNKIGDIDWSNWYAIEDVSAILKEMGYELDTTTEEMQEFIEAMREAGGASPVEMIERTKEAIEALGSTLSKGVAPGSLLDEETYKKLIQQNAALADSFMKTIDGSYKYVGGQTLGLEQLGLGNALEQARELTSIYDNAKEKAGEIDFFGMANDKYTFKEEMEDYEDAIDDAEDRLDELESKNEDWNLFTSSSKTEISNAEDAVDELEEIRSKAREANKAIREEMTQSLDTIMNDKSLMAVSEQIGWTAEELQEIQDGIAHNNEESIKEMQQFSNFFNAFMEKGAAGGYDAKEFEEMIASTATSIQELMELQEQYGLSAEAVNKAWQGLEQQEKFEDIDTEEMQQYAKHLQNIAKESENVSDDLEDNVEAAEDVALYTMKMNKGIEKLADGFEDWSDVLNNSSEESKEYCDAMSDMKNAMSDVLGVSEEFLSDNFILDNMEDIKLAAEGDAEAIDRLAIAAGKDILVNLDIADEGVREELLGLHEELATMIPDLKMSVGTELTGTDEFVTKANEIVAKANMTAAEANAYFRSMGFTPHFKMVEASQAQSVPLNTTHHKRNITAWDKHGNPIEWTDTEYSETKEVPGGELKTALPSLVMEDGQGNMPMVPSTEIESMTVTNSGSMNNYSSINSGGETSSGGDSSGKTKPKPIEAKKEEDEIERYHEILKIIEDQERAINRLSRAKDKAYGANKLKAMDKEIAALKELNNLDSQHLDQIREKLTLDRELAHNYGVTFDDFGRINNYDEIIKIKMGQWKSEQDSIQKEEIAYEERKEKEKKYDADGSIKLDIETRKEKSDEDYENFKEAMAQYEETMKLFEDTVDRIQERWDQIADIAVEKITYKIEYKIEYNDFTLDLLDFQISQLGEDFDKFSEIVAYSSEKIGSLNNKITALSDGFADLATQYQLGDISFERYVEELKNKFPDILSAMEAFIELDKEMMEYYASAFDAAEEEFTSYLDLIDHGISKLDHFKNMLSILRKENNNELINNVLQAQYLSASHRLSASADWYETTKKEYDALYNRWKAIQDNNGMELDENGQLRKVGEKELEMLEEKLKVASTKMKEADEQRLTDLEQVGAKAQEILQNNLDSAKKKLEKNLVGSTLEDYMTNLDRLSKKQEEYLTNTNKMYETNKLIRQAQLDIDKTENKQAKQQYNDYIKYIEQLQESGRLSQYELSIAQAKYELLQAQIALEEAQEAKNQVRLTRDAEGNYGYVYTADEDKVSDAEQSVDDAENKLYNIGLDGAKDYQSKKAEVLQEAIDTFADLEEKYQTGEIATEEEFNQKMLEAKNYYYDLLKDYDELYYLSLGTMQEESYNNTLDYELNSTNVFSTFESSVNTYLTDVQSHFDDYDNKVKVVEEEVGRNLEELKKKTEEVTTKTGELQEKAQDLTDTIDNELLAVRGMTSQWGKHRDAIYENIEANRILIGQLREIQDLALDQVKDYASYLKDLVSRGGDYDSRLVQQVLMQRWEKMGGEDTNDYQKMINDYVAQYAANNNLSLEEAEAALQNDSWYKALQMMRRYKIERTDWAAVEAKIKANDPNADTSWVQEVRKEKLEMDWEGKIRQYAAWNPGITLEDPYLQEMLGIRQAQIDFHGGEEASGLISNDELIKQLSQKSLIIDTRQTTKQEVADPGAPSGETTVSPPSIQITPAPSGQTEEPSGNQTEEPSGNQTEEPSGNQTEEPSGNQTAPASDYQISAYAKDIYNGIFGKGQTRKQLRSSLLQQGFSNSDIDRIFAELDKLEATTTTTTTPTTGLVYSGSGDLESKDPPWEANDIVYIEKGKYSYEKGPKHANFLNRLAVAGGLYKILDKTSQDGSNWYKIYDNYHKKYTWIVGANLQNESKAPSTAMKRYDTGGYTGTWGPEGKIAMLHEKELVLNKHDTENFLIGIDMLRSISDMLDKNALIQSIGMISSEYLTKISDHSDILQQEVTIHADFPNVQDHNEIEIAIDNLINAASQYAYRK